ncbi:MAG: hypothetical protein ACSLFR_08605 [Solirubrobacteraceae bacterium]
MRHRQLHDALRDYAEQAGGQLAADAAAGADIPFEVVENTHGRHEPALYCYRPLTAEFVRRRIAALGRLPAYPPAVRMLEQLDVTGYLRAQGEQRIPERTRDRADAALRIFISAVYADTTEFVLTDARFDPVYDALEQTILAGRTQTLTVVSVLGLEIESDRIALGEGLELCADATVPDAPLEALAAVGPGDAVLAVLSTIDEADGPTPATTARARLRQLQTALRLFDSEAPALAPVAYVRTAGGPWGALALGTGAHAPRGRLELRADEEDELRGFCSLVARRAPRHGEIAWALRRYELGCDRLDPLDGLTDHLLALRALLEPEGPQSGRLAERVAALCAPPEERPQLMVLVGHAIAAERAAVAALTPSDGSSAKVAGELADHLRAVLRDVVCGHLDSDLRAVADRVLTEGPAAPLRA